MENELVYLKGNDVFIDSLVIAEGVDIQHKSIVRTVKAKAKRLEKFGGIEVCRFQITKPKRWQTYKGLSVKRRTSHIVDNIFGQ